MNREKIPQQLYNLLEDAYRTFYRIVFLEVSKPYGIEVRLLYFALDNYFFYSVSIF